MLGAIIGAFVGSRFEFNNHRAKDFDLFAEGCVATDDSIMTLAVAAATMEAEQAKKHTNRGYDHEYYTTLSRLAAEYMREIGRKYPDCGFGAKGFAVVVGVAGVAHVVEEPRCPKSL